MDVSISHDPFAPEPEPVAEDKPKTKKKNKKEEPVFPSARLTGAGASADELARLEADFDASSAEEKTTLEQHLAAISESDIRDWLDQLRDTGAFSDGGDGTTPEPIPTPDEPEALIGTEGDGSGTGGKVGDSPFDPADLTVEEAVNLMAKCTPEQIAAVKMLEAAGKDRKTIAEYTLEEN